MKHKVTLSEFCRTMFAAPFVMVGLIFFMLSAFMLLAVDAILGHRVSGYLFNW